MVDYGPQDDTRRQDAVMQCLNYDLVELEAALADARRSLMQLKMLACGSGGQSMVNATTCDL